MSLYENMNKRKRAGTSRSKSKSTVSDKAYAEMKAGYRSGGMVEQMSEQMDVSKKEAGGLMKKAKSMNDAEGMNMGGMKRQPMPAPGMGGYEMNMADGGMARIKGAPPSQVKGLTYNDNSGKGTF
tara:strand:+ start:70 stop:444 length:375 start_codon:yes stop_codon:yes gene_type:complete